MITLLKSINVANYIDRFSEVERTLVAFLESIPFDFDVFLIIQLDSFS